MQIIEFGKIKVGQTIYSGSPLGVYIIKVTHESNGGDTKGIIEYPLESIDQNTTVNRVDGMASGLRSYDIQINSRFK